MRFPDGHFGASEATICSRLDFLRNRFRFTAESFGVAGLRLSPSRQSHSGQVGGTEEKSEGFCARRFRLQDLAPSHLIAVSRHFGPPMNRQVKPGSVGVAFAAHVGAALLSVS